VRIDFVSLFPEMILPSLAHSILRRAQEAERVQFRAVNPRDFCYDRHQKVDDAPFGGEPGMLIRPEPVAAALEWLAQGQEAASAVVLTAPTGKLFNQAAATDLARLNRVVFLCGHYEGFDHRVETQLATHVFSIGDYVLTNGEMPALVMADAIVRLLPGVLGDPGSLQADSFNDGLLSAPNYTRPEVWQGEAVPAVLKSGDHKAIAKWRREQSLNITASIRPDLLSKANLSKADAERLSD
jgi:tRNA (guanine37-N1)-methyltransferase